MWDIKREGGSERDQTEGLNFRIPCHFILHLTMERQKITPSNIIMFLNLKVVFAIYYKPL